MSFAGISLINNLSANTAGLNLQNNQAALASSTAKLSSGLRINTAADDPSGLAIAESLQAQVNGFDQAVSNVQNANNAASVALGALTSETSILQRIRSLAVEAASDINSTNDKSNLQTEVSQLLLEVNRISQNTTFNGLQLLDGSHAGYVAAQIAGITITSNSALSSTGQGLIGGVNYGLLAACVVPSIGSPNTITGFYSTGVTDTSSATGTDIGAAYAQGFTTLTLNTGSTVDGTIELQVVNTGLSIAVIESFFNSGIDPTATQTLATVTTANNGLIAGTATITNAVSVSGQLLSANSTYTVFDNVAITLGAFGTNDVGVTDLHQGQPTDRGPVEPDPTGVQLPERFQRRPNDPDRPSGDEYAVAAYLERQPAGLDPAEPIARCGRRDRPDRPRAPAAPLAASEPRRHRRPAQHRPVERPNRREQPAGLGIEHPRPQRLSGIDDLQQAHDARPGRHLRPGASEPAALDGPTALPVIFKGSLRKRPAPAGLFFSLRGADTKGVCRFGSTLAVHRPPRRARFPPRRRPASPQRAACRSDCPSPRRPIASCRPASASA